MVENQFQRNFLRFDSHQSSTGFRRIRSSVSDNVFLRILIFATRSHRFGLPVNFVAIVIHPTRKTTKRLRDALNQQFGYLDQSKSSRESDVRQFIDHRFVRFVFFL